MFNVELVSEGLERMNLQRRRDRDTERRERVFNDRLRTIGVDTQALDAQVVEKKKEEEKLEEKQKAHDAEVLHNSRVARVLQHREEKKRRAMQRDLVNYWQQHQQQPGSQQEFDLNDTENSQMMPPGFVGEDPENQNRVQRQREQLREWLLQQRSERTEERHQQTLEDYRGEQMRLEMDSRALHLQNLEMETRRAQAVATKEFNLSKIEERRRQESNDELNGGVDIDPTRGRWGVPGLCPGSDLKPPPETLEQVLQFQKNQAEEKKRAELEKKLEEEQHDRVRLASARSALLIERKQAKMRRQMRRQLNSTNSQLAEIQRQQRPSLERGHIDDSFFSNFNTCGR